MSDAFTSYETGLHRLLKHLQSNHSHYAEVLTLQSRLLENISQARTYGDTESRRAERAQVVDALNRFALEAAGVSFNELCRTTSGELLVERSSEPPDVLLSPPCSPPPTKESSKAVPRRTGVLLTLLAIDFCLIVFWGWCLFGDQPNLVAYLETVFSVVGVLVAILTGILVMGHEVRWKDVLCSLGSKPGWTRLILGLSGLVVAITFLFWPLGKVGKCRPTPTPTPTSTSTATSTVPPTSPPTQPAESSEIPQPAQTTPPTVSSTASPIALPTQLSVPLETPQPTETSTPTMPPSVSPTPTPLHQEDEEPSVAVMGEFEIHLTSQVGGWLWIVRRIVVQTDGMYRLDIKVQNPDTNLAVGRTFDYEEELNQIFLVDNIGNQYFVVHSGGLFKTSALIDSRKMSSGWLFFPPFQPDGTDFLLHLPDVPPLEFTLNREGFVSKPVVERRDSPGDNYVLSLSFQGNGWWWTVENIVVQTDNTYSLEIEVQNLNYEEDRTFDYAERTDDIFVVDNLQNYYYVKRAGGVFAAATRIGSLETCSGSLVFPRFQPDATDFFLHLPGIPPVEFALLSE